MTLSMLLLVVVASGLLFVAWKFPRIGVCLTFLGIGYAMLCIFDASGWFADVARTLGYVVLGYSAVLLAIATSRIYTRRRVVAHAA